MVKVGDPGNASVGVVSAFGAKGDFVNPPANGGIYATCADAPPGPTNCLTVGGVDYTYEIGELEVTVDQYVTFLNTVDPDGTNSHDLYLDSMSPDGWPKYGSIAYRGRMPRRASTTPSHTRSGRTSRSDSPTSCAPHASSTR